MPNRANNDLDICHFIENQDGIRGRHDAIDARIVCPYSDMRMEREKLDDFLNASVNAPRPLRRLDRDAIKDRAQVAERRKGYSGPSQPVFGPGRSDWFVGCELAASGRRFGRCDSLTFLIGKRDYVSVVAPSELKNEARDIVLRIRREATHGFKRFVEQSRHATNIHASRCGSKPTAPVSRAQGVSRKCGNSSWGMRNIKAPLAPQSSPRSRGPRWPTASLRPSPRSQRRLLSSPQQHAPARCRRSRPWEGGTRRRSR
jgi:hypothetical protein